VLRGVGVQSVLWAAGRVKLWDMGSWISFVVCYCVLECACCVRVLYGQCV
jgi:hypothetical protein